MGKRDVSPNFVWNYIDGEAEGTKYRLQITGHRSFFLPILTQPKPLTSGNLKSLNPVLRPTVSLR